MAQKQILLPCINDPERVATEIGYFIVDRVLQQGSSGCVIGLSGGVDSTTVAALTKRAFDRWNIEHQDCFPLKLVGYILPSQTNAKADSDDGVTVAERLGIRCEALSIEPLVTAFMATNPEAFNTKFDRGNMTSRIRAVVLNTKAATERKLVVGTGNRDEDYGIGYYTLFGDGAVHLSPIGCLSKRLVRQMACYLGFGDLADRVPTAGLEPGQTDFKDLGYDYDVVELVSEGLDQGFDEYEISVHPQVFSLISLQLYKYEKLYGKTKLDSAEAVVKDIMCRKEQARAKAQIISPPVPKISLEYK
jgi:NAD+ synthase